MTVEQIRSAFVGIRASLAQMGLKAPPISVRASAVRDQVEAAYRRDLVEVAIDPTPENIAVSLSGVLASVKMLMVVDAFPVGSRFVMAEVLTQLGEAVLASLDAPPMEPRCERCFGPMVEGRCALCKPKRRGWPWGEVS